MALNNILQRIKNKGVMRTAELEPFVSSRAQLRRYVESGKLVTLGAGIYAHPSLDPFTASILAVTRYYPNAVISNRTALVVHGLSDERVDQIDVDIPRESSIRNKLIKAHRVSKNHIVGTVLHTFQGWEVRIYCCERTLCDAYRLDPDGPIFLKALKRYVKSGAIDSEKIRKFDLTLRTNVLRALIQELADE